MSYVPTPPPPRPYWRRTNNSWAVMAVDGGKHVLVKAFTKQEYFKLRLADRTEDALRESWEKWRKNQRPVLK